MHSVSDYLFIVGWPQTPSWVHLYGSGCYNCTVCNVWM